MDIISKIVELSRFPDPKIALFDMDGTLLNGDIGESVFCFLTSQGLVDIEWNEYLDIEKKLGVNVAYRLVAECMAGLEVRLIENVTMQIINSKDDYFEFFQNSQRIINVLPKTNYHVKSIFDKLIDLGFDVKIISASSDLIVKIVGKEMFGIDISNCLGIKNFTKILDDKLILSDRLVEPAPVLEGKAQLYQLLHPGVSPLFVAGDSINDIPMFNLTDSKGAILIVGNNPTTTQHISNKSTTLASRYFCF